MTRPAVLFLSLERPHCQYHHDGGKSSEDEVILNRPQMVTSDIDAVPSQLVAGSCTGFGEQGVYVVPPAMPAVTSKKTVTNSAHAS
jgi:hypothetical protein